MMVFVSGATGFIGAACSDALAHAGHSVVRGARRNPTRMKPSEAWLAHGDIRQVADWPAILSGCDAVVHCAGVASVEAYGGDAGDAEAVTVNAMGALAEGAVAAGVRRIVLVSSALIAVNSAGDQASPHSTEPASNYARAKQLAEQRLEAATAGSELDWVILRPPMVYGPGCGGNFRRLEGLIRRRVPLPLAAATAPKSFIAIDNLTSAIAAVLKHPAAAHHTYFVCDDELTSTAGLVRSMAAGMALPAHLIAVPETVMRGVSRMVGLQRMVASLFDPFVVDGSAIKSDLCWNPPVSFDDGVRAAIARASESRERYGTL